MAEHLIATFIRAADDGTVKGDRTHTIDKQAVKLRAVGTVTEGVDGLLSVDGAIASRFLHLRHSGGHLFTQDRRAGIKP